MPHHTNGEGGFNGISALTIGWMSYRSHAQCVNRVRGLCVELLGIQGTRVIPYCHLKTTTTPVAWGIPCGSLCWDGIGHTHGAHAGCARGRHTRDWICTVAYHQSRGGDMTGKQQRNGTRRAAPVLTWVLLTAATVAALTVGACALWLPDRAPSVLSAPSVVESACVLAICVPHCEQCFSAG